MLALLAALLACEALLGGERSAQAETPGGDDSVIVRFRAGADAADRLAARRGAGAELDRALPLAGLQVVQPRPGLSAEQLVTRLERSDDVLYAEPDARRTAFVVPNDPYMWTLWGLNDTGQSVAGVKGTPDADIDATEAWDLTTGDSAVTVGIVDSGLDATHADLAPNLWANAGESGAGRETNGLDDDGDGQIDDVHGWDWVERRRNAGRRQRARHARCRHHRRARQRRDRRGGGFLARVARSAPGTGRDRLGAGLGRDRGLRLRP